MDRAENTSETLKKDKYLAEISSLIDQLNSAVDGFEKEKILKQIKLADSNYLEGQGMMVHGHILLSRHGECKDWDQKKFGLNPNAPISDSAKNAMKQTKYYTSAMLSNPDESPTIKVSPMVRAMETASLIIPSDTREADISIVPALSEDSGALSGLDVRSKEDMKKAIGDATKLSDKAFLIAGKLYAKGKEGLFSTLESKREEAAKKLDFYGGNSSNVYEDDKKTAVMSALDFEGDKIEVIIKLINDMTTNDLWLIGHGKNFKALFTECFGMKPSFDFCETRSLYKIQAEGTQPSLFSPPYSLKINQQNGLIEGNYTGVTAVLKGEYRQYIHQVQENSSNISTTTTMTIAMSDESPVLNASTATTASLTDDNQEKKFKFKSATPTNLAHREIGFLSPRQKEKEKEKDEKLDDQQNNKPPTS